jgi:hypothetical protein
MKIKILFICCFILLTSNLKAQTYYNKAIDLNNQTISNAYSNMLIDNDTIYCIGVHGLSDGVGLNISNFDVEANNINAFSVNYDSSYTYGGNNSNLLKFGNNFFATGYTKKINNNYNGLVIKFDKDCDTVWIKQRSKASAVGTTFRYSIKTSESTFVTLGDVAYYNSSVNWTFGQIYLVKFDTLANVIWERELGYSGNVSEFVKGIYPAADGGFFIYGYKTNYQAYSDCYLLKVDSMGNQLWQRFWGESYHDELRGFYEMPNGNLLVSGYKQKDNNGFQFRRAYLAMLTPDGSQRIWEKTFFGLDVFNTVETDLFTIYKNNDETFHIWGEEENYHGNITRPFLMHFSSNFDSLDTKYYSYWNGPGAQNYIRDIVKMPDQGYVACGFGWDNAHDEDGWLLRIDSNGCANVNCTPLAIQENTNDIINELEIYPNPATDKIYIKTKPTEVIKNIRLFDIRGTAIKAQITGNEIDVSMLANGLYIIEITNVQGNIQRFKALKE